MQIYVITINPTLGNGFKITQHPLGEFDWMEEAELREYLAACPWEHVPISQCTTDLAEGIWNYIKLNLQFIAMDYRRDESERPPFIRELRRELRGRISDNIIQMLVIGEKSPPRKEYTDEDRNLDN